MQDTLEKDLDLLAADREVLGIIRARHDDPREQQTLDSIDRSIGRIDVARRELIERSTFAIAGRGFEVLFGPGVTSLPELEALVEAAVHAMLVPRPDFHLDPSALEPDAKAEHDAAVDEWSSAQQQYLEHATEERVFALAILGCEVLRSLGKASLAEVPLTPLTPKASESPSASPIESPFVLKCVRIGGEGTDARVTFAGEQDEIARIGRLGCFGRHVVARFSILPDAEVPG